MFKTKGFKKIVAIIAASTVIISMAVSTVFAATCPPHTTRFVYLSTNYQYGGSHQYLFENRINSDGSITPIYKTCNTVTSRNTYGYKCINCGVVTSTTTRDETTHSSSHS